MKKYGRLSMIVIWMMASGGIAGGKMEWWRDATFGMFIHWGIYAVPARGEWVMNNEKIPITEYEKFAAQFNPVQFDADAWVRVAREAGQKYLVITSKHHDGFCMWDSKVTDYDILDRTPFRRDVIRELADACERGGVAFGVYHSILDWHHPDALAGRIRQYRDNYLFPQVRELIENYHPRILWFDGDWQSGWSDADAVALYNLCVTLDPSIIVNDRVKRWMSHAGDYVTPEQEIPEKPLPRDWETCQTINWNWGYNKTDNNWKSADALIHMLIETVSKGGNLLLNVGPTALGVIPAPSVDRLKSMGNWLEQYGETVYGCAASPMQKVQFGRVTYKSNTYYLQVFAIPPGEKIVVPFHVHGDVSAQMFTTGTVLPVETGEEIVEIDLAGVEPDPFSTVVTFKADGEPVVDDFVRPAPDGRFDLEKTYVFIVGTELRIEPQGNLGYWTRKEDYAYWKIQVGRPGKYNVSIQYAVDGCCGGNKVAVKLNDQVLRFTSKVTGGWQTYKTFDLGSLDVPAGMQTISVLPDGNNGAYINLLHLYLIPEESSRIGAPHAASPLETVRLDPAFPNPTNGSVTLRYSLPDAAPVRYAVYDMTGRKVHSAESGPVQAGVYEIRLDTQCWPTGLYFFILTAHQERRCEKFLLVR